MCVYVCIYDTVTSGKCPRNREDVKIKRSDCFKELTVGWSLIPEK